MTIEEKRISIKCWCLYEFEGECSDCPFNEIVGDEDCYTGVSDATIELRYQLLVERGFLPADESEECE